MKPRTFPDNFPTIPVPTDNFSMQMDKIVKKAL